MQKIVLAHRKETEKVAELVSMPVVLTAPVVRLYYRKLVGQFSDDAVVLSFNEIEPQVKIQSVGTIALEG